MSNCISNEGPHYNYPGINILTDEEIYSEAASFWRESEFYDICCDSDADEGCEWNPVLYGDNLVVIHNQCINKNSDYYVTLTKGHPSKEGDIATYAYITYHDPTTKGTSRAEVLSSCKTFEDLLFISTTEIKFWSQVAELYATIPDWMIEFDSAQMEYDDSGLEESDDLLALDLTTDTTYPARDSFTWYSLNPNPNKTAIEEMMAYFKHRDITIASGLKKLAAEILSDPDEVEEGNYISPFDGQVK